MAQLSKQALIVGNNESFPNNTSNYITPAILRSFNTDMIDSLVDENTYNVDSASWNRSISSLNQFTASAAGLSTASLLVTASASSNVITFTKGDASTFNVTVADTTNLTPLNQFTASATISLNNLNQWTSSYQPVIVNLQASQSINETKFGTIGTQSGSWDNTSLNTFSASANTQLANLSTSQSIDNTKWNTIGGQSGSWGASSGSVSPGTISGSAQISALGFVSSSVTASSLVTASIVGSTITFTKGDASQFNIVIPASSTSFTSSISVSGSITISGSVNNVDYIDFNTASATPTWKSGRVFWDNTDGCLAVYNVEQDVTLQVGQENWTRVFNGTGLTIQNGAAVRLSGTHGDVPEIVLAQSIAISGSANITNQILGLATHTIETGTYGYITTQGLVRGLNTNAFTDGATLYVSQSAGLLSTTPPPTPFEKIPIGQCVKASPGTSGIIYVAVEQPIDFSDLSSVVVGTYADSDMWVYEGSGVNGSWNHRNKASVGLTTTSSFNTFTQSVDAKFTTLGGQSGSWITSTQTGSFATTGSNNFTGIQTLGDAALNAVSLVEVSSSLMLVAKGFTSASAHLSSSINSGSNLIFKYNSQTVDTIISGSGNIFPNFTPAAAGFKRYVGGSGNIFTAEGGVSLSGSMAFPVNMNKNIGDNTFIIRGPISSSVWTIDQNLTLGGSTSIGTSAANNAEKIVGGLNISQNANWGGTFSIIANKTPISSSAIVTSNLIFGAAVTANLNSSSMNYSSNIQNGGITINNNYIPVGGATGNNARIGVLINTIYGVNHRLNTAGTNTSATNSIRSMYAGFLAGSNISASIEGTGDNTSLVAVGLLGNGLIVSGSSTNPNTTPLTNADGTHGSFIAGRYNAVDGTRALSAETVFAVGTGTGHNNRKTGFLIDSGSNTFIEGTLNVSGSTTITGSLTLSSSAAIELNVIGNMTITGSASGNVVSMSITSNTASLDFNAGNYFELTASVSPLNINVINLSRGTTSTLSISGSTASTITFSPNVQQPSGSLYTASVSGQTDILSFVAFNTSKVNVVSTLKMV